MRRVSNLAERVSRAVDVVGTPGASLALLAWRPRSVSAARLVGGLAQRGLCYSSVIDVGANVGQFSRAARGFWPDADIVAFEPLPVCAEKLRESLCAQGRIEVHEVAVGREVGTVTFHPHDYTLASSVLPATATAKRDLGWAAEQPSIEVPLTTLDAVFGGRALRRPTLLKLDVQGFELEVLAGAPRTLAVADAVLVEVAFERTYEGQPLFGEVHDALTGNGWELAAPIDGRREGGRIIELDCLYQRPTCDAALNAEAVRARAVEDRRRPGDGRHGPHSP